MIILIANHYVEYHPTEHFLRLRVGEMQPAHNSECLFIGISSMDMEIIMSCTA